MNQFEDSFVQHIPNSYYELHDFENRVNAIFKARKLLLLADDYLHSNVNEHDIKAIFVPHAGFKYSGICAASAYNAVLGNGSRINKIKNIVILSTRHSGKAGILVPNIDYFVYNHHKFRVNNSLYTEFNTINGVIMENDIEFLEEHSIEIQMPFIWNLFVGQNIKYLPILVGQLTNKQIYISFLLYN
jgi:AmmeMemoRadiSam system protein B